MEPAPLIEYAGFWRRLVASLIDSVLLLIVLALLFRLLGFTGLAAASSGAVELWGNLIPMLIVVVLWVRYGTTPGKQLLDCHIVDARSGGPLTLGQSVLRYVGYLLSTLPFCLGFLWVAVSRRKQGFHDLIARTVVIHSPLHPTSDPEAERPIESFLKEHS